MILRVVCMTFNAEHIETFIRYFEARKQLIRNFEGCLHLELWQQQNDDTVFFTYSTWINEEALENYRQSDFFKETWSETKKMFAQKPQAWTVNRKQVV